MEKLKYSSELPIGVCSDHAGYLTKQYVISVLESQGIPYKDFGAYGLQSSDYPDFAHPMAYAIEKGECSQGIAVCSTGNGINITMNKHQGVRAALCWNAEIAHMARLHNDANVLTLPGKYVSQTDVDKILEQFFNTEFEGGRHQRRVDKIRCA